MNIFRKRRGARGGFSLIEIILAIGVFALTIVAVIGMLGSSSQATSDVINTVSASQIADAVRTELEIIGYDQLLPLTAGATPLELVGTKNGDAVVQEKSGEDPTTNPPGMPNRDRFFLIQVERLGNPGESLEYKPDGSAAPHGMQLAVSVRIYWPHNIPTGLTTYVAGDKTQQSVAIFNMSIPRTTAP